MTRTIIITEHDGTVTHHDFNDYALSLKLPIGLSLGSPQIMTILQTLACHGFADENRSTPNAVFYVAPSAIKSVQLIETK